MACMVQEGLCFYIQILVKFFSALIIFTVTAKLYYASASIMSLG